MGKKKNTKKPGVGVEFKKVKHKVGKKLPRAANETTVDFKSRTINLPSQSITAEKETAATSRRNLTVKELLSQTGHHNVKTRKEAIQELGDLLTRFPAEAHKHTGLIIETLAERVSDADKAVRTAFCEMLKEKLLPLLSPASISPFLPVLMAHLCSAMTNLSTDIRLDALNFLHALMEAVPELLSRGFLVPCLQHLQDLLSQLHRARSLKAQSLPALLKVVSSMSFFLQRALNKEAAAEKSTQATMKNGQAAPGTAAAVPQSVASIVGASSGGQEWAPLGAACCARNPETAGALLSKLLSSVSAGESNKTENLGVDGMRKALSQQAHTHVAGDPAVKQVAIQLLCALFDCWSEATPAQLASAPELEPVQVLLHILRCANTVMERLTLMEDPADREKLRKALWARVYPFFPAPAPPVKPSQVLHEALVQFNLESAQLLINFTPQEPFPPSGDEPWVQRLVGFYCGVIERGEVLPVPADSLGATNTSSGRPTHSTAAAVLATIPALLSRISPPGQAALLAAVQHLSCAVPITSPTQSACILLQQELLAGALRTGGTLLSPEQLSSWLEPLPKMLWELGTRQPETSLAALHLLHEAARCYSPDTALEACLSNTGPQLAPLFCIRLPTKAATQSKQKPSTAPSSPASPVTVLFGPLTRLGAHHQVAAIDVLPSLPSLSPELLKALTLALSTTSLPEPVALRLTALLTHASPSIPFQLWASILGSILMSPLTHFQSTDGASLDLPSSRFDKLVDGIATHWRGGHSGLLATLAVVEEQLLGGFREVWRGIQSRRWHAGGKEWTTCRAVSYGIVKLVGSCQFSGIEHSANGASKLHKELPQAVIAVELAGRVLHVLGSKGEDTQSDELALPSSSLTQEQAYVALALMKSTVCEATVRIVSEGPSMAANCMSQLVKVMDQWSESFKEMTKGVSESSHTSGEGIGVGDSNVSGLRVAGWGLVGTACALARACMKVSGKDESHGAWVEHVGGALKGVVDAVHRMFDELTDGGQLYVTGQAEVSHIKFVVKDWMERGGRGMT